MRQPAKLIAAKRLPTTIARFEAGCSLLPFSRETEYRGLGGGWPLPMRGGQRKNAPMLTTTKPLASQFDGLAGRKFSKAKSIADRLGICSRTIFRWADAGKITRHKINARVVLFDEADVLAFIEAARVG